MSKPEQSETENLLMKFLATPLKAGQPAPRASWSVETCDMTALLAHVRAETAAERDELKEAKRELLERLENLLAWAAFRSDWPAGEEPPEHDISMARAAIAKHSKGE